MSKERGSVSRHRRLPGADGPARRTRVVQVQLSDVSRQDAPAPVIAETTFTAGGRQVPLPFELRYAADTIELQPLVRGARDDSAGEGMLLFTDRRGALSVITSGNPEKVETCMLVQRTR